MVKKLFRIASLSTIGFFSIILICNLIINAAANGKTFYDVNEIAKNRVGMILGTSNKLTGGQANPYYRYRITAALELYKAGKIEFILVSGDNGTQFYNEPKTIKNDLVAGGVPANKIFLDYAGFRTLDSVVRAKMIFGLDQVTIISQKFHNERAIYLAEKKGLTAIGFNAQDVSGNDGLKVHTREYLARVKVFIDLLINTQPKFYGDKILIE